VGSGSGPASGQKAGNRPTRFGAPSGRGRRGLHLPRHLVSAGEDRGQVARAARATAQGWPLRGRLQGHLAAPPASHFLSSYPLRLDLAGACNINCAIVLVVVRAYTSIILERFPLLPNAMNADILKRVVRAIADRSHDDLDRLAKKMVEGERRAGHAHLAEELEALLQHSPKAANDLAPPTAQPLRELPTSRRLRENLVTLYPRESLEHHMVLPNAIEERFSRIEQEYAARDRLANYGLKPRKTVLLHGFPGCGKSLGAKRLAWNTGLPLMKVRFDALLSSYFGESAANLRSVFDAARERPCVLLLDECDFIARSRTSTKDIGEASRIVNALLQLMEEYDAPGLLVATTNIESSLDEALFRRFDDVFQIPLPGPEEIEKLLHTTLSSLATSPTIPWKDVVASLANFSAAQVVKVARDAAKSAVLSGKKIVELHNIKRAVSEVRSASSEAWLSMPINHHFQHLPLLLSFKGPARLHGGGNESEQTKNNRQNRNAHSNSLGSSARGASAAWQARQDERGKQKLPEISAGVPLILEVDTSLEIDELRHHLGFEIICEQEDGYIIVASKDIHLQAFLQKIQDFTQNIKGSSAVAKIHRIYDESDGRTRLERILNEVLARWPFKEDSVYIFDFGITCLGTKEIPSPIKRRNKESNEKWALREAAWSSLRSAAYEEWDAIKSSREDEIVYFVESYGGEILRNVDGLAKDADLPDSFSVRIEMSGRGMADFIQNYAYIFEVVEPDDIDSPQRSREVTEQAKQELTMIPPEPQMPRVCVIDSGIQEGHYLLEPAIEKSASYCFLPSKQGDVADYVPSGGHGTRVAGAVLYGETLPQKGEVRLRVWLQNARVLDENCAIPNRLFPPAVLCGVVEKYYSKYKTRIFNHSINARVPCRLRHMSAWAAEIDWLCEQYDILIVQSAGNVSGVENYLYDGKVYPYYLDEHSCRIANPAQSLQALTVGSVAYEAFKNKDLRSFASERGQPSSFSRSGFGIWSVIKPEVVEYGGDNLRNGSAPPDVTTPDVGQNCYPELVRSTLHGNGPAFARDHVGTSYAAPKVAHIAARVQEVLPAEPAILYKTLVVQSARWPTWTTDASPEDRASIIRWIGYGVPDVERATTNTDYRTTLVSAGTKHVKAGECDIYQVPIPASMRRPSDEYDILIEVTLSYIAKPRRTRRYLRRYLSVWVDWISSNLGESLLSFRSRAIKTIERPTGETKGSSLPWTLNISSDSGSVQGTRRSAGTVQKDWAVVKSNALPDHFCIAVRGHEGWSNDPDSSARYCLAVSFEVINSDLAIYDSIRVEINNLQAELDVQEGQGEVEMEVDVEH